MNAKQKSRLVYLAAFLLIVVIVGYNIWSYCAGYCTVSTLMTFSVPAKLLLAGIFLASLYLLNCKFRNKQLHNGNICSCGAELREDWTFCPVCGEQRKRPMP